MQVHEAVILAVLSAQGVLGNILIMVACAVDKNLRQYTDAFVINVAIFDLIVSGVLFPSMVVLVVEEHNIYSDMVCSFLGALTIATCTGSIMSLTVVAVNRCIYICHNSWYKRIFSKKTVSWMLFGVWMYTILMTLPTLVGWGGVGYEDRVPMCCFDHRAEISYTFCMFLIALGAPLVTTFLCYAHIFLIMYRSRSRMEAHDATAQSKNKKKYLQILTMFAVSASFTIFWLPYCIVCVLDNFIDMHDTVIKVFTWLGLANSCINSFILGMVNKNYHAAYKKILCFCKRRGPGVHPVAEATAESSTWKS